MAIKYFLRMECGSEDRMSEPLGPFDDYLQLTYTELTTTDGRILAQFGEEDWWYLADPALGDTDQFWSVIVMWAEDVP